MGRNGQRRNTCILLVQHEVHHRGQLTVLMRQAGLRPPGIYGPTFDDWKDKGQTPYI